MRGEPSPVPMCPSGRVPASPEQAGMRLPSSGSGRIMEEQVASPARYAGNAKNAEEVFSPIGGIGSKLSLGAGGVKRGVIALNVEFVAKPDEARRAESAIPAAVVGALKEVTGFAGCLVLVSEHEARLVTVVTLWKGANRARVCAQNVRWVKALLKPYLDRCLRVQTMNAYLPTMADPAADVLAEEGSTIVTKRTLAGETICVV